MRQKNILLSVVHISFQLVAATAVSPYIVLDLGGLIYLLVLAPSFFCLVLFH